jgi:hypothetical protein
MLAAYIELADHFRSNSKDLAVSPVCMEISSRSVEQKEGL